MHRRPGSAFQPVRPSGSGDYPKHCTSHPSLSAGGGGSGNGSGEALPALNAAAATDGELIMCQEPHGLEQPPQPPPSQLHHQVLQQLHILGAQPLPSIGGPAEALHHGSLHVVQRDARPMEGETGAGCL